MRDLCRRGLLHFTKKAFNILPEMERPRILDIGCGRGETVLKLSEWTDGDIVAVDIDPDALENFRKKVEKNNLSHRISLKRESMFDLQFLPRSFDIIWSEGAIASIGFMRGLTEWGRFLKSPGYMIIHDEESNVNKKKDIIHRCGFDLVADFFLDEKVWWENYCRIAEENIDRFRKMSEKNPALKSELDILDRELKIFKKNPNDFRSVFFIMRK